MGSGAHVWNADELECLHAAIGMCEPNALISSVSNVQAKELCLFVSALTRPTAVWLVEARIGQCCVEDTRILVIRVSEPGLQSLLSRQRPASIVSHPLVLVIIRVCNV